MPCTATQIARLGLPEWRMELNTVDGPAAEQRRGFVRRPDRRAWPPPASAGINPHISGVAAVEADPG